PPAAPLTHAHWRDGTRTACALVRPDGYLAWSAPTATDAELTAAAGAWLLPRRPPPGGPAQNA
ncbi:FAD-dependent oxidoreductase, partial [Streptomyces sp. CJ_13]|nr:FAD-dependent oxidoreductase [Streptomyces sp. CJ_13]